MNTIKAYLLMTIISSLGLGLWGCSKTGEETTGTPNDPGAADSLVQLANTALGNTLNLLINGTEPEEPDDIDFQLPNSLYEAALGYDETNVTAHFGAGLCGMMMITQDPDIQAAWNEWSAFLDTTELFEPLMTGGIDGAQPPLPGLPSLDNYGDVMLTVVPATMGGLSAMALGNAPMLSELQALIETELLPRLTVALDHLEYVDDDTSFVFMVTPEMQGDPYEDPIELDLTEVYGAEAEMLGVEVFARMLISYTADFATYDSLGLIQAFTQGGANSLLTLRSGGATNMAAAKTALLTALDKMWLGTNFLEAETDDQNNDAIKIEDEEDQEALDSLQLGIGYAQQSLAGNWSYEYDWDDNPLTPDQTITFHLGSFFDNPIEDFKELLPPYTVSVIPEPENWNYVWNNDYDQIQANVNIPEAGQYTWERSYSWSTNGYNYNYTNINVTIPEFENAFNAAIGQLQILPNINYFHLSLYWGGYFNEGGVYPAYGPLNQDWTISYPSDYQYRVWINWTAPSYQQWIFPNPTFNGFMPGMTDPLFKQTFGITEEDDFEPWDLLIVG